MHKRSAEGGVTWVGLDAALKRGATPAEINEANRVAQLKVSH